MTITVVVDGSTAIAMLEDSGPGAETAPLEPGIRATIARMAAHIQRKLNPTIVDAEGERVTDAKMSRASVITEGRKGEKLRARRVEERRKKKKKKKRDGGRAIYGRAPGRHRSERLREIGWRIFMACELVHLQTDQNVPIRESHYTTRITSSIYGSDVCYVVPVWRTTGN